MIYQTTTKCQKLKKGQNEWEEKDGGCITKNIIGNSLKDEYTLPCTNDIRPRHTVGGIGQVGQPRKIIKQLWTCKKLTPPFLEGPKSGKSEKHLATRRDATFNITY